MLLSKKAHPFDVIDVIYFRDDERIRWDLTFLEYGVQVLLCEPATYRVNSHCDIRDTEVCVSREYVSN